MTDAKQGHRYTWNGVEVIAMENGPYPEIHRITPCDVWPLSYIGRVNAESLRPLPMVYFNGEIPK